MKDISQIKLVSITILLIIAFTILSTSSFAYPSRRNPRWEEYKSEHFIIHYHPRIPHKYISKFARRCERYYHLITERLNLRRFDFWTWDNRAQVFIYSSRQDYIQDCGRPKRSLASVQVKKKSISTYYIADDLLDRVLAHEITHIVLRELIGSKTKVPLWFQEGVASIHEQGSAASPSLVTFLLEEYGKEDFVRLCRKLRDGRTFYTAMDEAYGIKNTEDLNSKFLKFLTWLK